MNSIDKPVLKLKELPPPPQLAGNEAFSFVFAQSMDLKVVLGVCLGYIVAVQIANHVNKLSHSLLNTKKKTPPKNPSTKAPMSTVFDYFVFAHNVLMAVFSAITFYGIGSSLVRNFSRRPFLEAWCDADHSWARDGAQLWTWIFYMSKYYELMDTAILILKGKQSSLLQTFHHSGSILSMWLQSAGQLCFGWIFTLFNSFIHTIMYTYYAMTCLGYRPSWKQWLTRMQIAQFLIGDPLGLTYMFLTDRLNGHEEYDLELMPGYVISMFRFRVVSGYVTLVFVAALVLLFMDFSAKTYSHKNPNSLLLKKSRI